MTDPKDQKPDKSHEMPVPPSGNLGLLAYGYRGLLAWRKARAEAAQLRASGGDEKEKNS